MTDLFSLTRLEPGYSARSRRLQDIGFIPGTAVTCLQRSPLGDPTAYRIRGTVIALRREDAKNILLAKEASHEK